MSQQMNKTPDDWLMIALRVSGFAADAPKNGIGVHFFLSDDQQEAAGLLAHLQRYQKVEAFEMLSPAQTSAGDFAHSLLKKIESPCDEDSAHILFVTMNNADQSIGLHPEKVNVFKHLNAGLAIPHPPPAFFVFILPKNTEESAIRAAAPIFFPNPAKVDRRSKPPSPSRSNPHAAEVTDLSRYRKSPKL